MAFNPARGWIFFYIAHSAGQGYIPVWSAFRLAWPPAFRVFPLLCMLNANLFETMSSSQTQDSTRAAPMPLHRALEKSEAVKDTVEQSAQELVVINAVLKQEIPDEVQTGEVAQALQKSDELEVLIQDSAADLAQVNEALEHEIGERENLERELARTRAELAKATGG
jgi:C4-dicarboxylate-specific signal transduction histidine kinase